MRLALTIATLALLPLTARADVASDFATLQAALPTLPVLRGSEKPISEAKTFIAGLTGTWAPFSTVAGGYEMPDPELVTQTCERVPHKITAVGDLGLEIRIGGGEYAALARLLFVGFGTFAGLPDEASLMNRLFGKRIEDTPEELRLRTIVTSRFMREVILLPSGENLLVVITPGYPAEIWSRCP